MISSLSGLITHHGKGFLFLEVQGIGYQIFLPDEHVKDFSGPMTLYIHEVIRENEHELFGFTSITALELFWKLLVVPGVGPRVAQKIIFAGELAKVKESITNGSVDFLTHIPGVGKKTAQKIILELKGTLEDELTQSSFDEEALQALMNLGYRRREVEQVLSSVEATNTDDCIREALRLLAR
ncbi:Holliday junction branch migration protein RuvA [Candidatus Uhrbacteria bacterium CG_4_9_14_3_um_filter_36_7]|uniref:Holliday junction branch migration complex subunit RuvA n=1 Tax=Candidatus Uhrbacteria bacterium CG_4_9_14_3_um_filter_36_7 TaxID=1975033 RepID=A0A2M7XHZ4_9BACT|nr:MAG: Holliday junction branch migration protein RuvA [Candidatus Uhrbacteria bacterium CG_4_9_14_3_um_filter_36_7]